MDIKKISIGKNPPWDLNVIIEIPYGGAPVKYEIDEESGAMVVDRFLHTAMYYPANYGFIPHTCAKDGDPVDALVIGRTPVVPGAIIRSRPIGVLIMEDEAGMDEKMIMVPVASLKPFYEDITCYKELPTLVCDQITHFFEHYKDLEHNKWVKVVRWGDAQEAAELIQSSITKD